MAKTGFSPLRGWKKGRRGEGIRYKHREALCHA